MSAGLIGFVADGGGFMAVLETFENVYQFNVSSKDNSLNALTRIMNIYLKSTEKRIFLIDFFCL